jgi:hypothetical protein
MTAATRTRAERLARLEPMYGRELAESIVDGDTYAEAVQAAQGLTLAKLARSRRLRVPAAGRQDHEDAIVAEYRDALRDLMVEYGGRLQDAGLDDGAIMARLDAPARS